MQMLTHKPSPLPSTTLPLHVLCINTAYRSLSSPSIFDHIHLDISWYPNLSTMVELVCYLLNLILPTLTFFTLFFFYLPFQILKLFRFILSSIFSENVAGKVVLITGASSGIGEHLAYEYASRGACLALAARREGRLGEVADRAREFGSPNVVTISADVSKVEDCKRMVDQTIDHFGTLDHLVNNAGINSCCLFEEKADITDFRAVMDTNFWGSAYTTRFAVPHLKNSKGKIVVLSSAASWLPTPRFSIYNASKAALSMFFETLRVELGSDITITIVTPGFVESELTQGKFMGNEGKMIVDQDLRDVQVSTTPVATVRGCAKAIVNGACRGQRYLTHPAWFKFTYVWKVLFPEIIEWGSRFMYLNRPGTPATEAPCKRILDLSGAKKLIYPSSIQTSEIKSD